ncbi:MAG: hypothetical protein EU981_00075 [Candidatus Liberibacter ctenarytainae]|uniref:Flagellar basal body-associated protein FliL n=1 Tax=Candidatus Liberibacter ctenarytainae TaxID=2020335 RepID=A0A937ADT2_9HYPH|nr:hypothetical protein [Candidatus Liberibacter ctenarytainae]
MLKFFFAGLWVSAITLVSFYMFFLRSIDTKIESPKEIIKENSADLIEGELVTIPVISAKGDIEAYFFIKLSFIVNKLQNQGSQYYLREIATDYLYTLLAGSPMGNPAKIKSFGIENLRHKIKDDLNSTLGFQLLSKVLINQLNYLSISDIHLNCIPQENKASDFISQKGSLLANKGE